MKPYKYSEVTKTSLTCLIPYIVNTSQVIAKMSELLPILNKIREGLILYEVLLPALLGLVLILYLNNHLEILLLSPPPPEIFSGTGQGFFWHQKFLTRANTEDPGLLPFQENKWSRTFVNTCLFFVVGSVLVRQISRKKYVLLQCGSLVHVLPGSDTGEGQGDGVTLAGSLAVFESASSTSRTSAKIQELFERQIQIQQLAEAQVCLRYQLSPIINMPGSADQCSNSIFEKQSGGGEARKKTYNTFVTEHASSLYVVSRQPRNVDAHVLRCTSFYRNL